MSDLPEFALDRVFDAPRELVWRAWTEPDLLHRWYGPGVETIIHAFDLRPGGAWLGEMKWDGSSNYSKVVFQEVTPPERLVWRHSSSDAAWNVITNPMMPDWPRVILTTVTFEEAHAKTKVRLTWTPFEASDAEIACFAGAMDRFGGGWERGYAIMDDILAELQAETS
ncbi:MAG: SRPBCC domain-containing protein [Caulobacterales bacterium]|nr:SRPBCC domain-containing protein [Caulobacterales bacterium]